MLSLLSSSFISPLISSLALSKRIIFTITTMSISLHTHAFAGNPIRSKTTPKPTNQFSPTSALEILKTRLLLDTTTNNQQPFSHPDFKVLPFSKGRPLASSSSSGDTSPNWLLGWISLDDCRGFLSECGVQLSAESLVYLGSMAKEEEEEDEVYWAIDVSSEEEESDLVSKLGGSREFCFVEVRTLMVATDWADERAMGELAIAGHVSDDDDLSSFSRW